MNKKQFDAIMLNNMDNVCTSVKTLEKSAKITIKFENEMVSLFIRENINLCHKISLDHIKKGESIIKYGEIIGVATSHINKGTHVHTHNIISLHA